MGDATTAPGAHLERLASLWRQERAAARLQFEAARQSTTLARRVARGLALDDLAVVEEQAAPRDRVRVALAVPDRVDLDALRLGPGDPILLGDGAPRGRTVRGVLTRRDGQRLWVMVDGELPEELAGAGLVVEAAAPMITFDRGDAAIARAQAARGETARLLEMLMGARAVGRIVAPAWQVLDAALDAVQRRCVELALRDDVALVHGPPGTGKTRTLVEIVR